LTVSAGLLLVTLAMLLVTATVADGAYPTPVEQNKRFALLNFLLEVKQHR
jgi:hypothetical protein